MGLLGRKFGAISKPTIKFSVNDGEWTMKTITMKTTEVRFRPGHEIDEVAFDGQKCRVSIAAHALVKLHNSKLSNA